MTVNVPLSRFSEFVDKRKIDMACMAEEQGYKPSGKSP